MIELPFNRKELKVKQFRTFLEQHGAFMIAPTNEWEILRYRERGRDSGAIVIYQNKRGRLNWQSNAAKHYRAWQKGEDPFIVSEEAVKRRPALDLATDASYALNCGSWGAVLFAPAILDIEASGRFKGSVRSSTSAEARAAANALHHFIASGDILPGDQVRLVCDNINVVRYISEGHNSKLADISEPILHMRTLAASHELILRSVWVKGHQQPHISTHARLNVRCDRLAKEAWRAV